MEQQSDEWFASRLGKATASRMADLMAKTKNGYGASRGNYMTELVLERLTGQRAEGFTNAAMQWGTQIEPDARAAYEFRTNNEVEEVGFIDHPTIPMSGASPDGIIGSDGLIEIKCPNSSTHIDYLLTGMVPRKYELQMQWQMACADRAWCDFVSYDPRLPANLSLLIKRIDRDDDLITQMELEVVEFLTEVDQTVKTLQKIGAQR
jgi:putative phage-type endonuclease